MDHLKLKTEVLLCTVQNINKTSCPTSMPKLTVHKTVQNDLSLESYKHQLLRYITALAWERSLSHVCWNVPSKLEEKRLQKWHKRENLKCGIHQMQSRRT